MLSDTYVRLYDRLAGSIPRNRLLYDTLHTLAYGTDASFYRLIPQLVVLVENDEEVITVLRETSRLKIPVTFRAAGTSLSGQAISDSVLIVLTHGWKRYAIADDASSISLQPGVVGAHANAFLAPFGKKIGPDPASIDSAMIGGIAANNASGMCCGISQNSYRTVKGMRIIFHDGTILDTSDAESRKQFWSTKSEMVSQVINLSYRIRAVPELVERIRRKYTLKNTTGYSLNAFVDYSDPIDIIEHLMIGSEGTLGFIAEITYATVPEYADKATSLIVFPDIETACNAAAILTAYPVEAVELMDRASLRSVQDKPGMPEFLKGIDGTTTALLVETRADSREKLSAQIKAIATALVSVPKIFPVVFYNNSNDYNRLWNIRKGLFPSIGAMRATGTTCIIEDIAVPPHRLAEATTELHNLFQNHGYTDAIIFGHAREGNLHFVFSQDFNQPEEVRRYTLFIDDVAHMIVDTYGGSLKAEHGTGRNMAPFVELEWGSQVYGMMCEVKKIFDPYNLLNPGVIINSDALAHVKNLKPLRAAHPIIDACIECGFCEVNCPSKNITLTPRQRITIYREMMRLEESGSDSKTLAVLHKKFTYAGEQTCATDGLCSVRCPVGIDTGMVVKELRFNEKSKIGNGCATFIADHFSAVVRMLRFLLNVTYILRIICGARNMERISKVARKFSLQTLPLWNRYVPRGGRSVKVKSRDEAEVEEEVKGEKVVYFPSCINRAMGISSDYDTRTALTRKTIGFLEKSGFTVVIPEKLSILCCGMAFDSKGYREQGLRKARELETALLKASDDGAIPVFCEMSPCLFHMKEILDPRLRLFEPIDFIHTYVIGRVEFHTMVRSVVIHTPCSAVRMGLADKFRQIAELCAERVVIPTGIGCCGWAGDRGFTYPELTESALSDLRKQIPEECTHGYSTSRTCEIGLSLHSGISYTSIIYLVDRCTTAKRPDNTV
jgi:D-lactate dehydrogenase